MIPRGFPLEALRAFEAVARHLSFTEAARELGLTQGAVSQRIKSLETAMGGAVLFRRLSRPLALTAEGQRLADAVGAGFREIGYGIAAIHDGTVAASSRRPLRLTVSHSIAARWLLPRLGSMGRWRSQIGTVAIVAEDRLVELGTEADVALRFGRGRYAGHKSRKLAGDTMMPTCSPGFLARNPAAALFGAPEQTGAWSGLPRLLDSNADSDGSGSGWGAWEAWRASLDAGGARPLFDPALQHLSFSHGHLTLQAAAQGLGIALARAVLVADDLAAGRLVRAGPKLPSMPARYSYHFISREEPDARSSALAGWLQAELEATLRGVAASDALAPAATLQL